MTIPRRIAKDSKKRRDYIYNLCGLPDDQISLYGTPRDEIVRKENKVMKVKDEGG